VKPAHSPRVQRDQSVQPEDFCATSGPNSIAPFSAEIDLSGTDLTKGYDYKAMINGTPDAKTGLALSPLFGQSDLFNPGFSGRLLLKFVF
jgi:hypothetical protein